MDSSLDAAEEHVTAALVRYGQPLLLPASSSSLSSLQSRDALRFAFSRIVGVESEMSLSEIRKRNLSSEGSAQQPRSVMAASPSEASGGAECLLLLASADMDHSQTYIEVLRTDLVKATAGKRTLLVLPGLHDIVHASVSGFGPSGEELICITERLETCQTQDETAVGEQPLQPQLETLKFPSDVDEEKKVGGDQFEYRIFVVLQADPKVTLDLTPRESKQHNGFPGYHAGYFVKSESKRSPNALILASDNCQRGISICEVTFSPKSNALRMTAHEKWNLATFQLWHNWDPFRQQISFIADCDKFIKTRVIAVDGDPDKRLPVFERNCRRRAHYRQGRPIGVPYGAGNSSPNSSTFVQLVNVTYECGTEDVALCSQLLRKNEASDSFRVICVVTLLRNQLQECTVNIDQFVPAGHNYRVCFLYLEGLIAILLPGVCVHFVDVAHKEKPPTYLFGASCPFSHDQTSVMQALSTVSTPDCTAPFLTVLPVPCAHWVFVPGTTWISSVRLSRSGCWDLMEKTLMRRHLGVNFQVALHGMIHVVTTHFRNFVVSDSNQRLMSIVQQSTNFHFTPDLLVEFVQGETYARWRNALKESPTPFWRFAPMCDEDGFAALVDEFHELNLARATQNDEATATATPTVLPFSFGSSTVPAADAVKEECFMTPEKWWSVNLIPVASRGLFRRFLSKELVPVQRISLQQTKRADDQSYELFVRLLLQRRQIPADHAETLAPTYVDHLVAVVDDLVTCVSQDPRSIHPHVQLSFLHVLNDALLSMQFPFRGPLPERFAKLALAHFPRPTLTECTNSNVCIAQLDSVVQAFAGMFPVSELARPVAPERPQVPSGDAARSRIGGLQSSDVLLLESAVDKVPPGLIKKKSETYRFDENREDKQAQAQRSVMRHNAACVTLMPYREFVKSSFSTLVDKCRNHPDGKFAPLDVEKVVLELSGTSMMQFHRHLLGVEGLPAFTPLEQFVNQIKFRQSVSEVPLSVLRGAAAEKILVTTKKTSVQETVTALRNRSITRDLETAKIERSKLAFERLLYPLTQ